MDLPENAHSNASYQYSYRVPSPPRIFVPPPLQVSIHSSTATPHTPQQSALQPRTIWPNTTFLANIEVKTSKVRDYVVDWSYSERQKAQEILPFLFLGPLAAARDKNFLQEQGITMVLGVRKIMDAFMLNPRAPRDLGLQMQFVDIRTDAELMNSFNELVAKVNEHLEQRFDAAGPELDVTQPPGRVLVFCESGNERSATAVAAYIMAVYGINVVEAIQLIQGQRFCVNIDDAARTRLDTYSNMLRARIDVLQANQGYPGAQQTLSVPNGNLSKKRSAEYMLEDELMTGMESGSETDDRFRRDSSAPFFDEGHHE